MMLDGSDSYTFDNQSGNMLTASWPSELLSCAHAHTCTLVFIHAHSCKFTHTHMNLDGVPFDGVPATDIATAFIPLVVVIYIFAAAGVVFSIICLTFNLIFRNKK